MWSCYIAWISDLQDAKLEPEAKYLPLYYTSEPSSPVNKFTGTKEQIYKQLFFADWTASNSISYWREDAN